jgi:hypothetical protein
MLVRRTEVKWRRTVHEADKLDEARYFLDRLVESGATRDRLLVKYQLSAFLSASRSVLQYSYEEAKQKGKIQWYENAVTADPSITFLRDERNANVHERPVAPVEISSVDMDAKLSFAGALDAVVRDGAGRVGKARSLYSNTPTPLIETPTAVNTDLFFLNWSGNETVAALCRRYLEALEALVRDGQIRGILTGGMAYP